MTDNELLAEYARTRSQTAFAEIVRRYAGMVCATCRRTLGDAHLAEDATQAVFLVLVRKARGLLRERSLAGWLFRVAEFTARDAQKMRARRARYEKEAADMRSNAATAGTTASWEGMRPHLNAALARLPRAQQEAIVLRYLRGLSVAECARALGCSEETVQKRLERGIAGLRERLARRDTVMPVALLGGLLADYAAEPAPASLVASIQAAVSGQTVAAPVLAMMEGIMKAMLWAKVKACAAALCAVAAVGIAVSVALSAAEGGPAVAARDDVIKAEVVEAEGGKVTLSAGEAQGVRPGFEFEITRDGRKIGVVRVTGIAEARSTCEVVTRSEEVRAGDAASTRLTVVDQEPIAPVLPDGEMPGTAARPGHDAPAPGSGQTAVGYLRRILGDERLAEYDALYKELSPKMVDAATRYEFGKTKEERERADAERRELAARLERKAAELLAALTPGERKRYDAACHLFAERVAEGKALWEPQNRKARGRDPWFAGFETRRRALLQEGVKQDDPRFKALWDEYREHSKAEKEKNAPIVEEIRNKEKALLEEYGKRIDAVLESTEEAEKALQTTSRGAQETF